MTMLDLAQHGLAAHRLTNLIVADDITQPLRDSVDRWSQGHADGSLRERVNYAVNCGACSSVWAAAVVLALAQFKLGRVVIRVLALSSAALAVQSATERF